MTSLLTPARKLWTPARRLVRDQRGSLGLPGFGFSLYESNLTTPSSASPGTTITTHTVANTKPSAFTQIIAATGFEAQLIAISVNGTGITNSASRVLMDIAIGAASSETIIIPDLAVGNLPATTNPGGDTWWFPLLVPAGSRLSARAQGNAVSDGFDIKVHLYGGPTNADWWAGSVVTAYGIDTATSGGVAVTAGASAAEGSWTEIVAATSMRHKALAWAFQCGGDTNIAQQSCFVDIGVGAATEEAIVENLMYATSSTELRGPTFPFNTLWLDIASGTRLAARASMSSATADSLDVSLYGIS
jgi:hypothetical protein